ncbi:MAG: ribonuclease HIII [Planctomycetota bacterium]
MKVKGITKEQFFEKLRPLLGRKGLEICGRSKHPHHIQFVVKGGAGECMVQIYESKKGTHARVINDVGGCEADVLGSIDEMFGRPSFVPDESRPSGKPSGDAAETGAIGTDESGKGDFFGPLVVAGVYMPPWEEESLLRMGVRDSKTLSDSSVESIAAELSGGFRHTVVAVGPEKYNELYEKMGNVNRILGWCHARVIENLLEEVECPYAITDQFGNKSYVEKALMEKGSKVALEQRPRAEEIPVVAAASILARAGFLRRLDALAGRYGTSLPKGASALVDEAARRFVAMHGRDALKYVAKIHFKNTSRI